MCLATGVSYPAEGLPNGPRKNSGDLALPGEPEVLLPVPVTVSEPTGELITAGHGLIGGSTGLAATEVLNNSAAFWTSWMVVIDLHQRCLMGWSSEETHFQNN